MDVVTPIFVEMSSYKVPISTNMMKTVLPLYGRDSGVILTILLSGQVISNNLVTPILLLQVDF